MTFRLLSLVCLLVLALTASGFGEAKREARVSKIDDIPTGKLNASYRLSLADSCVVRHDHGLYYRIDGWVTGNELYKSYCDPAESCTDPYPFLVTAVNMPMVFDAAVDLIISADIESVDDMSYPGCNIPGQMLAITQDYTLSVPEGGGLFDIWIPLDTPITVNGPFFAGFFISNIVDASVNAAVITDSVPANCVSFNIWDPDLGYADLCNNDWYNFPGRLVMYASGVPGGGTSEDPPPSVAFASPADGAVLNGETELWAMDRAGSRMIDYVSFSYAGTSTGGSFVELGSDHDGDTPLRNDVDPAVSGTGFSLPWDFSSLPENTYTLRATMFDTLGRSSVSDITVTLEPTPPVPRIVAPDEGDMFCTPLDLAITCSDENVSYVEVHHKPLLETYDAGVATLYQNVAGDSNGNPYDGNTRAAGEYGDYYSAPASAALAAKLWYDRGITSIMEDSSTVMSIEEVTEAFAALFKTRANLGTYDEFLISGMRTYIANHGDNMSVDYLRNPDYTSMRKWVEEDQRAVLLGLGGSPGYWMALSGFTGLEQTDGSYLVKMSIPMAGIKMDLPMRVTPGGLEISYDSEWHPVEIMVSMLANDWDAGLTTIGVDFNGADGWAVNWTPVGLTEGNQYYFRSWTQDETEYEGSSSILLEYNCTSSFNAGDYNNDGVSNLADLYHLIDYIVADGIPPAGGPGRADSNCDGFVNVADIVYYINYLFGTTADPCY